MKTLRRTLLVLIAIAVPLTAVAHPGHEDPEFTWDFQHLVEHPFATFLCFAVIAAGAWVAWRLARRGSDPTSKKFRDRAS